MLLKYINLCLIPQCSNNTRTMTLMYQSREDEFPNEVPKSLHLELHSLDRLQEEQLQIHHIRSVQIQISLTDKIGHDP